MPVPRISSGYKLFLPLLQEKFRTANRRLLVAMACYCVLIGIAAFALDGFLRTAVLFYFAILVIKTLAHSDEEPMD